MYMLTDDEDTDFSNMFLADEPMSYKKTVKDHDHDKFETAMAKAYRSLYCYISWTLAP